MNTYSLRKLWVGLANAAFNALKLTVIKAIATVITAADTNIHQYIGVRYANPCSHWLITI